MSIIHEALKKAEREREPRRTGLPFHGGARAPHHGWRRRAVAGLLIGVAAVWAVNAWLRPPPLGPGPQSGTTTPTAQSVRAAAQVGDDPPTLRGHIAHPTPIQAPLDGAPAARTAATPLPPAVLPPASEARVAAQATFEWARAAEFRGEWEEAEGHYRQALKLNPALVEARNNLGTLYVRQHQLTAAIDELLAAVRIDPHYAKVRNNLGSAYFLSGQEALAIQEFLAALHIDGAYVSPLYNLASLYARRGDVGQAVAFLTRALAIEPAVLSWLREDPDFDRIKTAPDVQRLYTQGHATR
jgi:tetratricopeptide (TPR) repeat protein